MDSLQDFRLEQRLSLDEAANLLGIRTHRLLEYERGEETPTSDEVDRLSDEYGVSRRDILNAVSNTDAHHQLTLQNLNILLRCTAIVRRDAQLAGLFSGSGGSGKISCPRCEAGIIHYSVTPFGDLSGACDTQEMPFIRFPKYP